ncbi:MAG: DUF3644 domain-containing protein [Candidatus Saganbacteria bacterium]|nr:DUF3644 domain-containing protein [Candidatus Saganbacteria bacterium]
MSKERHLYSEKVDLINKARESALAAVQIYNNPLTTFKSESFIVLFMIAWTYLLHAYYRSKSIDYRYYEKRNKRKKFKKNKDGSVKYWDLTSCLDEENRPLDVDTTNNLKFLIGLRNQIEHRKANHLDSYLSARYQACAINFNYYIKKLFGDRHGLDNMLALSLQFAELDYSQSKTIRDKDNKIPQEIKSYIAKFDSTLSEDQIISERYAYRILFTKVIAKRAGQADRVIEFLDPKSPLAENIKREYWVKEETEKRKYLPKNIVEEAHKAGFDDFNIAKHYRIWKQHNAKETSKGYGFQLPDRWYWYEKWKDFVLSYLAKQKEINNHGT